VFNINFARQNVVIMIHL